ncbi:p74 [Peridroma alphabaculovirus]|uniref:p74 n=1 Tax=Peridroma alphabaculovirus TaxID=1346829 RepID=A0A068LRT2_9ABAC|nr:p74 [Peridroma alphabaculovirus]AIE47855.1 p74 [Peridroma alphabaculovirus]
MAAPTLTQVDYLNAEKYSYNLRNLRYISQWRAKMPHILIDYDIRAAGDDDYYVPAALADKALRVHVKFSERGCASMSCYPFSETGPVNVATPTAYTQTSETAVRYAQPACYNLDRAAATREGAENEVQAPELRYTAGGRCLLVDTLSKMYLNSPYLRTDEHLIKGVDDVPGFNVRPSDDPVFPERYVGTFNEAYCRRFGRNLLNGGCHTAWWESLIGFVLGDTIYITMKMLANNVFSELRSFDYRRPSPVLPAPPTVDAERELVEWRNVRDPFVDVDFEKKFGEYTTYADLGIDDHTMLVYTAERGFSRQPHARKLAFRVATSSSPSRSMSDDDLNFIISQFLEDQALILGIATSFGFDYLFDALKALLKRINSTLIPLLKQTLVNTSRRVTARILGETYKAAVSQAFSTIALKTISTVAKALTRIAIKAASVVGIILIIMSIADLILGLWDPFGYNNMFPREFPDDLSLSFLTAYFDSFGGSRDFIEFIPEYFDELINTEDIIDLASLSDLLEYVASLEVNSNGQRLDLDEGEAITDFDEVTLVGDALASSALYTYLDFMQYTERHNKLLFENAGRGGLLLPVMFIAGALLLMAMPADTNVTALFVIFLLIAFYLIISESLHYYMGLREHTDRLQTRWYDNLYSEE